MSTEFDEEILARCNSKKANINLYFYLTPEKEDWNESDLDADWITDGISETFWENIRDFEDELNNIRLAMLEDKSLTLEKAIQQTFGDFYIEYEINGVKQEHAFEVVVNECMRQLIQQAL